MSDTDTLLTMDEVADRLRLHPVTVRRMVTRGVLPSIKLGDKKTSPVRVRQTDLDTFLERRARRAPSTA